MKGNLSLVFFLDIRALSPDLGGTGGMRGTILLASKHVCPKKHIPESNHLKGP